MQKLIECSQAVNMLLSRAVQTERGQTQASLGDGGRGKECMYNVSQCPGTLWQPWKPSTRGRTYKVDGSNWWGEFLDSVLMDLTQGGWLRLQSTQDSESSNSWPRAKPPHSPNEFEKKKKKNW